MGWISTIFSKPSNHKLILKFSKQNNEWMVLKKQEIIYLGTESQCNDYLRNFSSAEALSKKKDHLKAFSASWRTYFSTITKFRSQNCEIDVEYAGQLLCGNATKMSRVFSAIDNEMIIEVRHVESVKCWGCFRVMPLLVKMTSNTF